MISDLPIKMQKVIEDKLRTVIFSKCQGLTNEERDVIIDDEMSGRLCDIEELIDINNLIAEWEDEQCRMEGRTMQKDDLLLQEKCANVLICLQNIASKNYRSAVNVPFYMDKAKEVERLYLTQEFDELMDICGHPRKYKNIIHLLNEVYESVEAVKQSRNED